MFAAVASMTPIVIEPAILPDGLQLSQDSAAFTARIAATLKYSAAQRLTQ